jgi:hypothetical protein
MLFSKKGQSKAYLGTVTDVDHSSNSAEIKFLTSEGGGKFRFPLVDDFSWEPLSNIQQLKVQPVLIEHSGYFRYQFPFESDPFDEAISL